MLVLQAKNDQSEIEIKRLTKTVRVVEVEVKEDNEPLLNEITRLNELCELLQHKLDAAYLQIEAQNREKQQFQLKFDKLREDFNIAEGKIASLE